MQTVELERSAQSAPRPSRPGRRHLLKAVVFVSGAVLMALEILGSRVLAPNYGSSVYVWGSLISTFLVALSVGYALGGRIADRQPRLSVLSVILSAAAVMILPIYIWSERFLSALGTLGWNLRWSALAGAVVLFLPPSLALGMITPFAVRLSIRRMETAGTVSGGFAALSTAGSILGTIAATFFLIPALPVDTLIVGLAATLVLCAGALIRDRASATIGALAGATLGAAILARMPPGAVGGERLVLRRDTPYHHIAVTQLDNSRWMRFDAWTQSGVNLAQPDRSVVGYDEALMGAVAFRPEVKRVCVIGLGGGSVSRGIARILPDAIIDSVEIDPVVRDIAIEYFLYRESERVRTVIEDGRVFLSKPGPAYDLIILDAFNSTGVPFHLTTRQFFETAHKRLSPHGVFAANFVAKLMGSDGRLFWATYRTMHRQFGQVYVSNAQIQATGQAPASGNLIVFATVSADPEDLPTLRQRVAELAHRWKLPGSEQYFDVLVHAPQAPLGTGELTDSYAPVEALQNF
jgi:spermidine synthase